MRSTSTDAIVRLAGAGLLRHGTAKALDAERLTEWLAGRCKLPYLRIDPLKVDVARVTEVMSAGYAEARRVLPVQVGLIEQLGGNTVIYGTLSAQQPVVADGGGRAGP